MWQTLKKQEIIEKLRTDEMQGLTEKQVKELQEKGKYTNKIHQTI